MTKIAYAIAFLLPLSSLPSQATSVSSQHSYPAVQQFISDLVKQYPASVKLVEIGQSDDGGQSIVGVQIGNGPLKNLIVGTHHGNEYGSTEVALQAALDLAQNPILEQTIFVIPVLNISGFEANRREESLADDLVDANRDYPGPCATSGPFHLKDTKALADFVASEQIVSVATLHTYGPLVLYPWGISTQDVKTSFNDFFIQFAQAGAQFSHYEVGNSTEALYPADGTFEDYAFWQDGIWSLLYEIGDTHSPDETELAQYVKDNVPGFTRNDDDVPRKFAPPITPSKVIAKRECTALIFTMSDVKLHS